jgi:hypothetical protein
MKQITAQQIIDNVNARLKLLRAQGIDVEREQLQDLLNDICRHSTGIANIDDSTTEHLDGALWYSEAKGE